MKNLAILAIDAATEACSVALSYQGKQYGQFEICPQQHSVKILPMVDEVLKQAGIKLQQLDALAFGCGPGSFTGVRIGVGVAQGLAFAADLPMIPVSSLQAMAQGVWRLHQANVIHCAIDARMGEVYCADFIVKDGVVCQQGDPQVLAPQQVEVANHSVVAGSGWQTYEQQLGNDVTGIVKSDILFPDAQDMLATASAQFMLGHTVRASEATPLYVRDTVTWKKLPGRG